MGASCVRIELGRIAVVPMNGKRVDLLEHLARGRR